MDNFRESYVKLDTPKKVGQVSDEKYMNSENAVYVFIMSTDNDDDDGGGDDASTVYNVPLKRAFGAKYKCASFYRDKSKIVLTLVSTGFPAIDNYVTESELPYGNSHVCLQNDDSRDVVFSFSTAKGHIPPLLLLEDEYFGRFTVHKYVALLSLLLMIVYYYYYYSSTLYSEEETNSDEDRGNIRTRDRR